MTEYLLLNQTELETMQARARRDDWHTTFVGSDIRLLVGQSMRAIQLQATLKASLPDDVNAVIQPVPGHDCVTGDPIDVVHFDDYCVTARKMKQAQDALRYWRDNCSGAEPSISVFNRMVDESLK